MQKHSSDVLGLLEATFKETAWVEDFPEDGLPTVSELGNLTMWMQHYKAGVAHRAVNTECDSDLTLTLKLRNSYKTAGAGHWLLLPREGCVAVG